MSSSLDYYTLLADWWEDHIEARANVAYEAQTVEVLPDTMSVSIYDEPVQREALERRKRHGVIGYS